MEVNWPGSGVASGRFSGKTECHTPRDTIAAKLLTSLLDDRCSCPSHHQPTSLQRPPSARSLPNFFAPTRRPRSELSRME